MPPEAGYHALDELDRVLHDQAIEIPSRMEGSRPLPLVFSCRSRFGGSGPFILFLDQLREEFSQLYARVGEKCPATLGDAVILASLA